MKTESNIQVGMGGTLNYWTDNKPVTIIAVSKSGRVVTVQKDRVVHSADGESQEFQLDPEGSILKFSRRKNGRWIEVGQSGGLSLSIGRRHYYYDRSF